MDQDGCSDSGINDELHSNDGHSDDGMQILKGMFPTVQETTLRAALTSAGNDINMAVDLIVCDDSVNDLDSAVDKTSFPGKCFLRIVICFMLNNLLYSQNYFLI